METSLYAIRLASSTVPDGFFLIPEHRARFDARIDRGGRDHLGWRVALLEETDRTEEVYCAVVPGKENFTLAGNINVMNCGQAYIVRVQPAFPGMPQMPMGPGAPSDVGPDGGLVDPGMIGPDGEPADGSGPPPDDAGDMGDGPPGAPDDDGGGSSSPPGDGKENGNPFGDGAGGGKGKKPPGKSKKGAAARYRGMQGQPLTERQFLRHIAVMASGGDPRVMAALRAEASSQRTALAGASHYRTLPSGHRVSIGRNSAGWYGAIEHPQSGQVHFMDLGFHPEPRAVIERHLAAPGAQAFIRATTPGAGVPPLPQAPQAAPWYQRPGPGTAPSEWRPAQASRGRRPFGRTAVRVEHNHEDMPPEHLRHHMRTQHGFIDTPDDPDWVIDETHRNEHADAPLEHAHPDLDAWEDEEDVHLGDRDWMHQHGIEGSRRPFAPTATRTRRSGT